MQDCLDDCRAAKAREGLRLHGLHLFKSSTLCRRPGRYAGGSSSGSRSTALNRYSNPLNGIAVLRSTELMWHPEYHVAREEKIRSLPIPSFEVAYPVRSRAMSARRQKWRAETANCRIPPLRYDQIDLDNGRPGRREWSIRLRYIFVAITQQLWHSAIF